MCEVFHMDRIRDRSASPRTSAPVASKSIFYPDDHVAPMKCYTLCKYNNSLNHLFRTCLACIHFL